MVLRFCAILRYSALDLVLILIQIQSGASTSTTRSNSLQPKDPVLGFEKARATRPMQQAALHATPLHPLQSGCRSERLKIYSRIHYLCWHSIGDSMANKLAIYLSFFVTTCWQNEEADCA